MVLVAGGWEARALMQAPGSWALRWAGPIDWRTSCPSWDWLTSPAVCVYRPRCLVVGRGADRQTRGCATRPIRRRSTVDEIILVMREAGPGPYAGRIRGLIAILWRAGLRISEALALTESDLDPKTGSVLVRFGRGGRRRIVGMDDWAWEHVRRWTEHRVQLPIGPLFCILAGPTRGRAWRRPRGVSFVGWRPSLIPVVT
jgi:integrase